MPVAGGNPEGDDLTDQAATFGIRAIAREGLLDPLGQYYGYDAIIKYGDRWVMAFRSSTCFANEEIETCEPNTGDRDESYPDAWLEIALEADRFVIIDAFGRFTTEQEQHLRAYSEPATIEETHMEFPTVRVDPSPWAEGFVVRGATLWAGPLPAPGTWSVCHPAVFDDAGNPLWRGVALAFGSRVGEYFRSNGLVGTETGAIDGEPTRAEMPCELWTGDTWVQFGEPTVSRYSDRAVAVRATVTWEHEEIVGLSSHCRIAIFGRSGNELKSKVVRGPESPWASRARRSAVSATFKVTRPRRVRSANVVCRARGQSFE